MDYCEKLTADNSVVILVDFLDGFLPGITTIEHDLLRRNAEALTRLSALFDMPTVMLGEEGSFRGNFFAQVTAHADHAVRIERHTPSAWDEPAFRDHIEKTGCKKIILGGISLDICTTLLTLDMMGAGYECYVVVDTCGSDSTLNEQAAMMRMTQAGAVMLNWASLASELLKDWENPQGEAVGVLYQTLTRWGNVI
ncbi:isochorismatase family protein [uncultured Sulfitobacter sp.]|uniref:isochorismatase family protein n=1 Tax=uncultured Sulfitobacter sp. TaxID=191468 RepID=UPI00262D1BF8|nr:isochorismatase family protein [uncultured Sulfitobacter sp.]